MLDPASVETQVRGATYGLGLNLQCGTSVAICSVACLEWDMGKQAGLLSVGQCTVVFAVETYSAKEDRNG